MDTLIITLNSDICRFEAHLDGEVVGVLDYTMDGNVMSLTSTRVDPNYGGRGIGGALVKHAFEAARESGTTRIAPVCPFTVTWVERHPGYQDLVAPTSKQSEG